MEQGMMIDVHQRGYALVTVLILTAVGLLFGAGALLLFRFQCQLRIDRQHELEKVYAVRSALNYIRTNVGGEKGIPVDGKWFGYHTGSERNLNLLVKPVSPIFPDQNREDCKDFVMERCGDLEIPAGIADLTNGWYNSEFDYECGAWGETNLQICALQNGTKYGLGFGDSSATNGVRWWINIGMRGTGGWLQDDYGRRYYFLPQQYVGDLNDTKDILRLCLIRNVTNESQNVGFQHGWPLSMAGERAIVFQIRRRVGSRPDDSESKAEVELYEYEYRDGNSHYITTNILGSTLTTWPATYNVGLQIAGKCVSIFYIENSGPTAIKQSDDLSSRGYTFFPDGDKASFFLSDDIYNYFRSKVELFDGKSSKLYGGILTNKITGKVEAPEMRAVFEVEANSTSRDGGGAIKGKYDFLTKFRVAPAYQYDVYLEHPASVTNRATIAQKIGRYHSKNKNSFSILTYDTHGTEHKGFRQDEREAQRKYGR